MRSLSAVGILAAAGLAAAQSNYTIDPNSVDLATRTQWCTSQKASCPLICAQVYKGSDATEFNDCNPKTLSFNCVCSNGMTPNASEFSQTIPYFECTEFGNQCVANCGSDNACSNACRADNPCGAQSPTRVNATTTTSAASSGTGAAGSGSAGSASATQDYSGFGGSSSGAANNVKIPATFMSFGASYGMAVVMGGLFAGAALIL